MLINEVLFAGNLGKDAELYVTGNGLHIVTINVCHTYKKTSKTTTMVEDVSTWVTVKIFDPWAQTARHFKKGDNVVIKGSLSESKWKDKESGKERSSLQIIANQVGVISDKFKKQAPEFSTSNAPKSSETYPNDIPF